MDEFERIAQLFAPRAGSGGLGLNDDVAKVDTLGPDHTRIVTTDAIVEGVHFLPDDPIDTVARKLVRVNVSDILAKGGSPLEALLTLGWSATRSDAMLAQFADVLSDELSAWGAQLIGGDSVRSPDRLFLSMTLFGACSGRAPILRNGAQLGNDVWVSGRIGAGVIGLKARLQGRFDGPARAYLEPPIAPLEISGLIANYALASLDVSDGLLADAAKLAGMNRCQLVLNLEAIPFAESGLETTALSLLTGGDDYQILFCAKPEVRESIRRHADRFQIELSLIGHLRQGTGLSLLNQGEPVDLPVKLGFTHA